MNILFVCSSSDWHMQLWLKYFSDRHNVVLFSDADDHLTRKKFDSRITIIEDYGYIGKLLSSIKTNSLTAAHLNKLISSTKYARLIDDIIAKYNIDIVHAHSLYYGYVAHKIKKSTPVVFTPMGSDIILNAQRHPVYKHMARKAFERANIVTGDSLLLREQGYKVGAKREHNYIVQNGVDTKIFYPKNNNLKARLGITDDTVLIFSPRALMELYNIDVIIESLAIIRNAGYKIKCMFSYAFGGEYVDKLKRLARDLHLEDCVIWLGFLEYQQMAEHYNAADLVVSVPSSDSSPKSVYEAMFCQKPTIISDLTWSHELLSECECVLRVKTRDAASLAKGMIRLINDTDYSNMLALNARNIAAKHFDYYINMARMEEIMLSVVNNQQIIYT